MAKKASLTMLNMQKQLSEPETKPKVKAKKAPKKTAKKGGAETKAVAPAAHAPTPKKEIAVIPAEAKESYIPRGERGDFLKTTITLPAEMFTELRALGMRRKSAKQKDTDTSALVREAVTDLLNKHRAT